MLFNYSEENPELIKKYSLIAFLIVVSLSSVFTQDLKNNSTYKPPLFIFELAGHFNVPVFDTRGDLPDFFTFKNYGLVYGIGFHFNVKYAANKKGTLFPYFSFGFCQLQNDDNSSAYLDSNIIKNGYPLSGNTTYGNRINGTSILALRIMHVGLGLQYYFSSSHRLLPYAGAEIDYNNIWGFYEQTPTTVAGSAPGGKTYFQINNASRVGLGVDLGMDYRITKNLGFVLGTKFKIANLFGKSSDKTNPASETPGDLNKMNLLDKSAPELNSNLSNSRNISYFEFYIGFSVFTGSR